MIAEARSRSAWDPAAYQGTMNRNVFGRSRSNAEVSADGPPSSAIAKPHPSLGAAAPAPLTGSKSAEASVTTKQARRFNCSNVSHRAARVNGAPA